MLDNDAEIHLHGLQAHTSNDIYQSSISLLNKLDQFSSARFDSEISQSTGPVQTDT